MLSSREIRQQFLDYFVKEQGHTFVPSSPVIPHDDPTLLFANAGMNQFKDVFLGTGTRDFKRAANSQKCIRAGGKHNDLDDVGKDTYHHTFFEMLGNWSFGDYFKKEAIRWAWDLLTNVWKLDKSRLHVTVFAGDESDGLPADDEAAELWRSETDVDPSHIHYFGKADNFWEMGATGPCGPCSEIHVDRTPDGSGAKLVNADDPRVMEVWNLVFIQFNRDHDGSLSPLPAKHVDTGMGFERITAVLQGKESNYDTDVFAPIFAAIQRVTGARDYRGLMTDAVDIAYRVIADHIRMATFSIADGATPGAKKRDAVLRSVIRRAVRHGRQTLGVERPFFFELVPSVVESMGDAFPELKKGPEGIANAIREEEEAFGLTLDRGLARFERAVEGASGILDGETAFDLESTYGFPLDLTEVMAQERGLKIDAAGYEKAKEAHRRVSDARGDGDAVDSLVEALQKMDIVPTEFEGYESTGREDESRVWLCRLENGQYTSTNEAAAGSTVAFALERTPFYAEAGGQVGDEGFVTVRGTRVAVDDTVKVGGVHFHLGRVETGNLVASPGAPVEIETKVDVTRRDLIRANHSTTHTLNHKLRNVLGDHVQQKGSLVDDEKTRFDFSHHAPVSAEELELIEGMVVADLEKDLPIHDRVVDQAKALEIHGLRAVFGEKYPPKVRVVSIGVPVEELLANPKDARWQDYSIEFCGGTHLDRLGAAGDFVFVSEENVAKGVRRVTAVTGDLARETRARGAKVEADLAQLESLEPASLADQLGPFTQTLERATLPVVSRSRVLARLHALQERVKEFRKEESRTATGNVVDQARAIADSAEGDVIVAEVTGADPTTLRAAMDVIRSKQPDKALLLATVTEDKCAFLCAVPKELIAQGLKAGDWVREVAKAAGGGGGGRPDMAQAGGKDPAKLQAALETGRRFAEVSLGKG